MRSPTRRALIALVFGQITTNSSPPVRASVSVGRVSDDEPAGDVLQHLVAERVTVAVVDLLEPVEVDQQDGEAVRHPTVADGVLEAALEQDAVAESGERIVQRLQRRARASSRLRSVMSRTLIRYSTRLAGLRSRCTADVE